MSDYSFMRSGFSNLNQPDPRVEEFKDNSMILLSLFSANAMQNAAKHVELCGRNGVTKEDVQYGLKYEVFEFLNRANMDEELQKIKEEMDEYDSDESDSEDYENETDLIVDDEEVEEFKRMETKNIEDLEDNDQIFINNMYKYADDWDSWLPQTPLETVLKNGINATYNQ